MKELKSWTRKTSFQFEFNEYLWAHKHNLNLESPSLCHFRLINAKTFFKKRRKRCSAKRNTELEYAILTRMTKFRKIRLKIIFNQNSSFSPPNLLWDEYCDWWKKKEFEIIIHEIFKKHLAGCTLCYTMKNSITSIIKASVEK